MKARNGKRTKDGALLNSVAESIGAALGTIAAKAGAAQKALTHNRVVRGVEREAKKLARKSTSRAATNVKRSKAAKAARRGLRHATSAVKRVARRR